MASCSSSTDSGRKVKEPNKAEFPSGVARRVSQTGLKTVIEEHEKALATTHQSIERQEGYQAEYHALSHTLKTLPDKLSYEALVPLGPLVLAKGRLIHSNEITCHIGDNWFVQCTSKTAQKIVNHRIQKSEEMLSKFQKEKELISSWITEGKRQFAEGSSGGTVDITELYDEDQIGNWRRQHRENVKKYYETVTKDKRDTESQEDRELWERLDMLELEEEMAEYESKKLIASSSTDTSEGSVSGGSSLAIPSKYLAPEKSILKVLPVDEPRAHTSNYLDTLADTKTDYQRQELPKRRVSFDASKDTVHSYPAEPQTPGAISSPVAECETDVKEEEDIVLDAFKHVVIEKTFSGHNNPRQSPDSTGSGDISINGSEELTSDTKPPQRVSLFKQRRMVAENSSC